MYKCPDCTWEGEDKLIVEQLVRMYGRIKCPLCGAEPEIVSKNLNKYNK